MLQSVIMSEVKLADWAKKKKNTPHISQGGNLYLRWSSVNNWRKKITLRHICWWQVLGKRKRRRRKRRRSEPRGSRVVCESVNCVTVSITEAPQGRSPPVTLILEQHWARSFTKGLWPVRRRGENRLKNDKRGEPVWNSKMIPRVPLWGFRLAGIRLFWGS